MITDRNQTPEKKSGHRIRPVLDDILNTIHSSPHRMPAGGWFREVATNENWRMTTVVQRHRDNAAMTPPS